MAFEIAMPAMGVTMEAGTVLKWLKQVGESVRREEPLMEIQTDKVSLEITSDYDGHLLAIVVPEGREVKVGTVLAYVGQAGEAVPTASVAAAAAASVTAVAEAPAAQAPAAAAVPGGKVRATPAARSRARKYGVDLAALTGTGPSGRVQTRDVEAAQATRAVAPAPLPAPAAAPAPAPASGAYRDVPVVGMRKVIAERMAQSFHNAVPVLLTVEVCMDRSDELLARLGAELQKRSGVKVGYLPLIVKAAAAALRHHPRVNAHWLGSAIRQYTDVNVGVAVALDEGLMVPVLRQADQLGVAAIAAGVADLAGKARSGRLGLDDLDGGTFTISNLGGYTTQFFMPVINPPQVAILGVGRSVARGVVRDGQVTVLPVLPLSLVFDHRAVDGAPAAAFLDEIKAGLEEPYRLIV